MHGALKKQEIKRKLLLKNSKVKKNKRQDELI